MLMNVSDALQQRFAAPSTHRHLIFWHDPEGEQDLTEISTALESLGVKVWEWTEENSFRTKVQLELMDPTTSYLIYARFARPIETEDWLLDLRLYSEKFIADEITLLIERLQVTRATARFWLQAPRAFFRSQDRVRKVERLLPDHPREDQLILAVSAVAVGVEGLDFSAVVRHLLSLGLSESGNPAYTNLIKWQLTDDFWQQVSQTFGLVLDSPTLDDLFSVLVGSHLQQSLDIPLPAEWRLPTSHVPNTCRILLDDALRSTQSQVFTELLVAFGARYKVIAWLATQPYESYARSDTLPEIHTLLLGHLAADLLHGSGDRSRIRPLLVARNGTRHYDMYAQGYESLVQAITLQEESAAFSNAPAPTDGLNWVESYASHWYRVDQAYRLLCAAYDILHQPEWLTELKNHWDRWYTHKFLLTYGEWTDRLMETGLAEQWIIMGVMQQRSFYRELVANHLSRERVYVIISDALRFEAGQELASRLQRRLNAQVELQPMQAVLPTYTQLGMASLLSGQTLTMDESGTVFRDGLRADGLENRGQILSSNEAGALALRLPEFLSQAVQDGDELIRGKRLVYLYHDVIDATGDQAKSETRTFLAVREAIEDLLAAVDKLVRSYRAVRIVITSDHGFLYQPSAIEAWAKPTAIEGTVYDGNRRFAIGRALSTPPGTRRLSLRYLGWDTEAVIATSINRLTVRGGGQRFVHGGAMPQEAIVPVITFRQIRGQTKVSDQARVDVTLTNLGRLVTSYTFTAVLFQEQKMSDALLSRQLRIALYVDGARVSTEANRMFDSDGPADQRQVDIVLHLFERKYPLGTIGFLRFEDISGPDTVLYAEYDLELRIVALT